VIISAAKSEPGTIRKEWIAHMASDSIVFACANPLPEIWPWDAKEAGARVVGTGRSDFPNQVNNSLGFPGIFRGALDVNARTITDGMCIAAARALADVAKKYGLREDYVIPNMDQWEVFPLEASRVGTKAIQERVARIEMDEKELYASAEEKIRYSRDLTKNMMNDGFIKSK